MIELKLKNRKYGIIEDGIEIIPFVHSNKKIAIEEWEYFETLNITGKQFLDHKRTFEEIDNIVNELNNYKFKL